MTLTEEIQPAADLQEIVAMTSEIVSAYVAHNAVPAADLPIMIRSVYEALAGITSGSAREPAAKPVLTPAVPIKKSVFPEYIVCLENGLRFKSLKRHLRTAHDMTPEQYRARWGLSPDYPMVAPAYAEKRSNLAKATGLGQQRRKFNKAA